MRSSINVAFSILLNCRKYVVSRASMRPIEFLILNFESFAAYTRYLRFTVFSCFSIVASRYRLRFCFNDFPCISQISSLWAYRRGGGRTSYSLVSIITDVCSSAVNVRWTRFQKTVQRYQHARLRFRSVFSVMLLLACTYLYNWGGGTTATLDTCKKSNPRCKASHP